MEFPCRNPRCPTPSFGSVYGFGLDSPGDDTSLGISLNPAGNFEASVTRDVVVAVTDRVTGDCESYEKTKGCSSRHGDTAAPSAKYDRAHVVGWPPIRSFRKNTTAFALAEIKEDVRGKYRAAGSLYVKVSMDGAPYLRKVDLKNYETYAELLTALKQMFSCFTIASKSRASEEQPGGEILSESQQLDLESISKHMLTYKDKDGDWMLVGDVPWRMFSESCRRMRIMKCPKVTGLGSIITSDWSILIHLGSLTTPKLAFGNMTSKMEYCNLPEQIQFTQINKTPKATLAYSHVS
ncbi:hypothetical protein MLD38_030716 [Melastoma candidum]|uniref:Uncharacterized protein n=1 Tax=Melastoma candidum TaxID=119954 RepID=A0ACB9MMK2_9MYRT|nr:hypothetical protein MLD38_030716 [Melastoma candidum]